MRRLVVVSHRAWLSRDFRDALDLTTWHVTSSLGLDVPAALTGPDTERVTLWTPMEWAARVLHAGVHLRLSDPGPSWLTGLPERVLQRRVWGLNAAELRSLVAQVSNGDFSPGVSMFCKPANAKIEALPAQWTSLGSFADVTRAIGLPDESALLLSDTLLDLVEEHRVFILDGRAVTSSPYLRHTRGPAGVEEHTFDDSWTVATAEGGAATTAARSFAEEVVATTDSPRAFVVDVASTSTGEWVVVEANPAWASNPYGSDLSAVVEVLAVACDEVDPAWTWRPDPYLAARAAAQRRLTLS